MTIDIITLFPTMFTGPFDESIVRRAMDKQLVQIHIHNLRKWAIDTRGTVDDKPYGGGVGMVMRPEPIFNAVAALKKSIVGNQLSEISGKKTENRQLTTDNRSLKTVLLDAGGVRYTQRKAEKYSKLDHLILICGHYEGVDFRVHEHLVDEVISIGDYVLTGGEIPAMAVVDSAVRLIPGVLAKKEATRKESFSYQLSVISNQLTDNHTSTADNRKLITDNRPPTTDHRQLLEHPQYTRPEIWCGHQVPDVLLSGNHAKIEKWRIEQSLFRTKKNRPDLL